MLAIILSDENFVVTTSVVCLHLSTRLPQHPPFRHARMSEREFDQMILQTPKSSHSAPMGTDFGVVQKPGACRVLREDF